MDKLDQSIMQIAAKKEAVRQQVDDLKRQSDDVARRLTDAANSLRELDIELKALEFAASCRPANSSAPPTEPPSTQAKRRGGRQRGAIAKDWREALRDLVAAGNQPVSMQQFYLLTRGRLGRAETSVRDRVKAYAADGILMEVDGKYVVSQMAIEKFNLSEPSSSNQEQDEVGELIPAPLSHHTMEFGLTRSSG